VQGCAQAIEVALVLIGIEPEAVVDLQLVHRAALRGGLARLVGCWLSERLHLFKHWQMAMSACITSYLSEASRAAG
jgi:hypothetical protein